MSVLSLCQTNMAVHATTGIMPENKVGSVKVLEKIGL